MSPPPRRYSPRLRLAAGFVLGAFFVVGTVTTVYSLGVYCLTTYAGWFSALTP